MTNIIKNIPILDGLTREELKHKLANLERKLESEYDFYNDALINNHKDNMQYHGENIEEIEDEILFYAFAFNCVKKALGEE